MTYAEIPTGLTWPGQRPNASHIDMPGSAVLAFNNALFATPMRNVNMKVLIFQKPR